MKFDLKIKYTFWILTFTYMALIFYLSSQTSLFWVERIERGVGFSTSMLVKHIIEYSILGILLYLSFRKSNVKFGVNIVMSFIIGSLYGILDEYHQSFVPQRFMVVEDMIANSLGIFIGVITVPISILAYMFIFTLLFVHDEDLNEFDEELPVCPVDFSRWTQGLTLDVGCGYEKEDEKYQKRGDVGIDLERGFADVIADAHSLPFRDNSFEQAGIYTSLDHFDLPLLVLKEVYRIAKSVEILTSNSCFWQYAINKHPKEHLHQWNKDILSNIVEHSGFRVKEVVYKNLNTRTWKERRLIGFFKILFRETNFEALFNNVILLKADRIEN